MTPIIILSGPAGSGKDTVADFIVKNHNAVKVAQADPMKRFAQMVFGFSDAQLWGPSEERNKPDPRFLKDEAWKAAWRYLSHEEAASRNTHIWLGNVLTGGKANRRDIDPFHALQVWFRRLENEWFQSHRVKREGGLSARVVLQLLGTEWGRQFSQDIWINCALRDAFQLLKGGCIYQRNKGVGKTNVGVQRPGFVVLTDGRFSNEILETKRVGGVAIRVQPPEEKELTGGVAGHVSESEMKTIPDHWFDAVVLNNKDDGLDQLEETVNELVDEVFIRTRIFQTTFFQGCFDCT